MKIKLHIGETISIILCNSTTNKLKCFSGIILKLEVYFIFNEAVLCILLHDKHKNVNVLFDFFQESYLSLYSRQSNGSIKSIVYNKNTLDEFYVFPNSNNIFIEKYFYIASIVRSKSLLIEKKYKSHIDKKTNTIKIINKVTLQDHEMFVNI